MSTNELEMKIRELRQLQQLIEEAQAEAEGIRDVIKAHMGERDWKPVPTMCEAKRSLPSPPPRHGASQW